MPDWGAPAPPWWRRALARLGLGTRGPSAPTRGLPELPLAVRRGDVAAAYLAAERDADHAGAAERAEVALGSALEAEEYWHADIWAHRALWHYEQSGETLAAIRTARRIGELRYAAGDAASARRYYAEAIDEARDVGAEHEQGLSALGLGRALLDLGDVTASRRLASAAVDLLDRSGAAPEELAGARELLGTEVPVGEARPARRGEGRTTEETS